MSGFIEKPFSVDKIILIMAAIMFSIYFCSVFK